METANLILDCLFYLSTPTCTTLLNTINFFYVASIYKRHHLRQQYIQQEKEKEEPQQSKKKLKMVRLSAFLKVFTTVTLVFLFFQTGSGRELTMKSSNAVDHYATTTTSNMFQKSRDMVELDYEDAGPNTNKRSGLPQPLPSPDPPVPTRG
uniref:uncharacterized protein LOC122606183 n=1 Tax=Erigeron canadensis TaxID=72917 RepID=UPI001CB98032|nr:uncharacterized protein LOC122606183 [Erigeron canadensis]